MIIILLAYLLFQIIYDHWSDSGAVWDVIYFSWQYGTIAAISWLQWAKTGKIAYMLIGIVFISITANELVYLKMDAQTYQMMTSGPPAYLMTIIATLLFFLHEMITRWKKRQSA